MAYLRDGNLVNGCPAICDRCGTAIKAVFTYKGKTYGSDCIIQIGIGLTKYVTPKTKRQGLPFDIADKEQPGWNTPEYHPPINSDDSDGEPF